VSLTRRTLLAGGAFAFAFVAMGAPVFAQQADTTVSVDKLMAKGALDEMALGAEDAPVTIVEYASMTCSHCADFHENTFPALKEKYIDTGKVRFVLREFPLDPLAAAGFMLARCRPSDQYFDMVDLLFDKQRQWAYAQDPVSALQNIAKQAGFTQESFEECLTNQELLDAVNEVKDQGAKDFGVSSTPTFFINGRMLRGARGIDEFSKAIDPELNG
jgi:protein-disulfide isomerase